MSDTPVLLERDGELAVLTLNRPKAFNAFDTSLLETLRDRLVDVARDPAVRAVVITGAGRAFCGGGDLKVLERDWPGRPGDGFHRLAGVFHQCVVEIRTMDKAVVAAVNGAAAGGGFSLALACDLRVMGESAFLQQAYTSSGLTLDGGGTFSLPRLVGLGKALELALLDPRLSAAECLALGLVHRVVPDAELAQEARALAGRLAGGAVETLGRVKRLMNQSFDRGLEGQLEAERRALADAAGSPEGQEGLAAFREKRPPDFRGAK